MEEYKKMVDEAKEPIVIAMRTRQKFFRICSILPLHLS